MQIKLNIDIKSSKENIFSYLENPEKTKLWMRGLEYITSIDENNPKKTFIVGIKEGGKVNQYNGYTPKTDKPNALTVVMYNDKFESEVMYRLSFIEDNLTNLDYTCILKPKTKAFTIFCFIFLPFGKIMSNSFMKKLKELAEK